MIALSIVALDIFVYKQELTNNPIQQLVIGIYWLKKVILALLDLQDQRALQDPRELRALRDLLELQGPRVLLEIV